MKSVLKGLFLYEVETYSGLLVDFYETGDDLIFEIDLPGIDPAKVSVRVYEDLLIIEGTRNDVAGETRLKYLCLERGLKSFRQVLKIPVLVNTMAGKAAYAKGVLTIRFPKLKGKLIRIGIEKTA